MKVLFHVGATRWPGYFEICTAIYDRLREGGHEVTVWSSVSESTTWFRKNTNIGPIDLYELAGGYEGTSPYLETLTAALGEYVDLQQMVNLHLQLFKPPEGIEHSRQVAVPWLMSVLQLLVESRPDVVVLYNGYQPHAYALRSICQKARIPVLVMEKGLLANSMQLDSRGINAESTLAQETVPSAHDPERVACDLTALRKELFGGGVTGWQQSANRIGADALRKRLGLTEKNRLLLYIGQVRSDSNLLFFSPHFRGNDDALRFLADHLQDRSWFILGKRHPFGEDDDAAIRRMLNGRGAWMDDIHLHDALELADAVVSINSSVVFESLLLKKPTILLGRGLFSGKGIALEYDGKNGKRIGEFLRAPCLMADEHLIEYWCWRTACEWLYRTRPEDIAGESLRAARQIEEIAGHQSADHEFNLHVWSRAQSSLGGTSIQPEREAVLPAPLHPRTMPEKIVNKTTGPTTTPCITAVVCTHNRVRHLVKAVESLISQSLPKSKYEILVVDNASTDDTPSVVRERFGDVVNLRYVHEPVLGLSQARNAGWQNARGKYVAYLDDDAVAVPGWLVSALEGFDSPKHGCVGGKIDLIWETPPPAWLVGELLGALGFIDWSPVPAVIQPWQWLGGGNSAYPTDLLRKIGGFSTGLGRKGNCLLSNDENWVRERIEAMGLACYYHPGMKIGHCVGADRLNKQWFVRRGYWQGISDAVMIALTDGSTRARVRRAIVSLRELCKPRRMRALLLPAGDGPRMYEKYLAWQFVGQIRANLFWRNERP